MSSSPGDIDSSGGPTSPSRDCSSDNETTPKQHKRRQSGYIIVPASNEEKGNDEEDEEDHENITLSRRSSISAVSDTLGDEEGRARPKLQRSRQMSFITLSQDEIDSIREQEREDAYYARVTDDSATGFGAELLHSAGAAIQGVVSNALEKARGTGSTVPEPAECGCPCFNYPDNGWRHCPFLEHKLKEAAKRGIVLGAEEDKDMV